MEENFETTELKPKDFPNIIILGPKRAFQFWIVGIVHSVVGRDKLKGVALHKEKL